MSEPLAPSPSLNNTDRGISYFEIDPTGKTPPKTITERQYLRALKRQHYITYVRPWPEHSS